MRVRIVLATLLLASSVGCSSSPSMTSATTAPSGSGKAASIVSGASTLTTTAFAPNPITVSAGGSVTWTNNDSVTHTSVGGAWNSGAIAPGGQFSMTFSSAGSFPYHCSIHPGMVGTVTVQ